MIMKIRQRALGAIALFDDATDSQIKSADVTIKTDDGEFLFRREDGYYILFDKPRFNEGNILHLKVEGRGYYPKEIEYRIPKVMYPDDVINLRLTANAEHRPIVAAQIEQGKAEGCKKVLLIPMGNRAALHLRDSAEKGDDLLKIDISSSKRLEGKLIYITDSKDKNFENGSYMRVKGAGSGGSYIMEEKLEKALAIGNTDIYEVSEVECEDDGTYLCMLPAGKYMMMKN